MYAGCVKKEDDRMICGFISRFEDGFAILEQNDRTHTKISRSRIPAFARPGDFLEEDMNTKEFRVDFTITEMRRQEVLRLADMLFE